MTTPVPAELQIPAELLADDVPLPEDGPIDQNLPAGTTFAWSPMETDEEA